MNVETSRLVVREMRPDDLDGMFALESDPEIVRYQTYGPRTREVCANYLNGAILAIGTKPRRWYELAVTESGNFIGRVGADVEDGQGAVWYAFLPHAQGKGYATEAMQAFLRLLAAEAGLHRITLECDPRNVGSWRLAERLGFRREAHHRCSEWSKGEWTDSFVYAMLTDEMPADIWSD